ncbi:hypothetical protein A6B43_00395 [Vespertiliibacter pulmonis]|uniref:Prophage antirepressor-like protein n=1 Tax=Vespertiliibacter pulmonis TaxID=1443036 RepID=A0A3N4W4H7_9PAST|nr:P22AR C-terminal domain-containing protein [Vespertiliibacter pulmonis]QLB20037.1 hypothetical protein A6B43_00045 [Vespertiliibacter pulmonis]QLB20103.1 hypothetical protein A6B43_00395 [Vespertiliibacter pulmonis]RPE86071.1 prophage antirepressor-like protein [Vespertiliibacter pulmonis]
MTTLTFQNKTLSAINQQNQIWLTVTEIGKALGYSDPFKSVKNLYDRHQDEFTPCMTQLVEMQTAGGMQKVRIFSLRGCHLIGMLSHTKVAKEFRRWVLDILDKEVGNVQNSQPNLPLVEEKKFTFELTQDEISTLLWLWFIAEKERDLIDNLAPALRSIGSHFAPTAESHATEYKFSIERARKILLNLSQTLNVTPWEDTSLSRVLPKIRNFNSGNPQRPRLTRR